MNVPTPAPRRLARDLVEAIRGSRQDFTTGSIGRAVVLLAVPMVLEMLMESIFAVVDVFFVARLGASAVATVGLTESVLTLVYAVAIGLSMGATAMVARRIGEKRPADAAQAGVQAIGVAVLASIPVFVAGAFFAPHVLGWMGADQWGLEHGVGYTRWMLAGNVTIMLLFVVNGVFRGAGDAAIAMRVLWVANGINIVLDPALINGWGPLPELGVEGAAIATNIGRATGVLVQLVALARGGRHIRVARAQIRLVPRVMARLLRVSLGGIGQFVIATSSWMFLMRIMAEFGAQALAGYTIAVRITIFTILPSWGLSNAAATLVGQNLGAGLPGRAERAVWITGWTNTVLMTLVGVLFFVVPEPLVHIFSDNPRVVSVGTDALRVFAIGYPLYAWELVMVQAFNGAGDTNTPMGINFGCFWMFELPLAWILAMHVGMDERGVYSAVVIAESVAGLLGIALFRRGRWKSRQI